MVANTEMWFTKQFVLILSERFCSFCWKRIGFNHILIIYDFLYRIKRSFISLNLIFNSVLISNYLDFKILLANSFSRGASFYTSSKLIQSGFLLVWWITWNWFYIKLKKSCVNTKVNIANWVKLLHFQEFVG